MLYLIHGEDESAVRTKFLEIRNDMRERDIRTLDGRKSVQETFVQALESGSMFGSDVLVVIEDFLSYANKRQKIFAETLARIVSAADTQDIILLERKIIDTSVISKLGQGARVFEYKYPVVLFTFLDAVAPGNAARVLDLLGRVLEREPAEVVYTLLVRRIRHLMMLKEGIRPKGMQQWQSDRLTNQARQFTIDQLVSMHTRLLDAEIALKSGLTPYTLSQLLELFITEV